ncbi:hypothetical protein [Neotabrizicola sp. sgz301269]|uniref:hypothetical protein n=1 Tax=Neotabrizicola sp. sgz301269 TaxID=3276282 RepID=UPI00376F6BC8
MKPATALMALALAFSPALALAEGCHGTMKKDVTASSCIEGAVWDAEKGQCVVQPSS